MSEWKELKIGHIRREYGRLADEWDGLKDDRCMFCNMYRTVLGALEWMPDDAPVFVKNAVLNKIVDYIGVMDEIRSHFEEVE